MVYFSAIIHLEIYSDINRSFLTFERPVEGKLFFVMFLTFKEVFHIHYEWNEILELDLCCYSFFPQKYLVLTIV